MWAGRRSPIERATRPGSRVACGGSPRAGAGHGGRSMRRNHPRPVQAVAVLAAISALALAGAGTPKGKRAEPPAPKVEETVSDLAYIASGVETKLEGVGLVVGL